MSKNQLTVVVNNKSYTIPSSHNVFPHIKKLLEDETIDWKEVERLSNIRAVVSNYVAENFEIKDNNFFYKKDGVMISTSPIIDRIMNSAYAGEDINMYLNFFDKVLSNPSESAREELFIFLQSCNLPIVDDGDFLAYKIVRSNYTDCHTGKFDNSVGSVVTMPREEVNADRSVSCSSGLHFCSKEYIQNFSGEHLMVLKINPMDVVSIPDDYNNSKGRCCKYQVIGEVSMVDIPDLKDVDYKDMIRQLSDNKVDSEVKETEHEVRYFNGNQKEFFKSWAEPRNTYTVYVLKHSKGETAYMFVGGTGQKCFTKVDMPEDAIPEFKTQKEAMSSTKHVEGVKVKIKGDVFEYQKVECSDGYKRLRLVKVS